MAEEKRWNLERLTEYLNSGGFRTPFEKENVLKELRISEILKVYLDTLEGAVILDSVVEAIADNLRKIVQLSNEGFDGHLEEIRQAAWQIGIAHKFMLGIVTALARGKMHEERLEGC